MGQLAELEEVRELLSRLIWTIIVGTLQNGYLRKVPLPRIPQVQRARSTAVAATLIVNPPDTGYLPDPRIPLYNNLSRLLLAVGKRCLPMRLVGWERRINSIEQLFVYLFTAID